MEIARTFIDIVREWNTNIFGSPGTENDRRALLDEMIAINADQVACEFVNKLDSGIERNMYSFIIVMKLLMAEDSHRVERARKAVILLSGMDQRTRFAANLEIFAASREENEDLLHLHAAADRLPAPDRAWAYLTIYGLTLNHEDLFLAGQAMGSPAAEPRFTDNR